MPLGRRSPCDSRHRRRSCQRLRRPQSAMAELWLKRSPGPQARTAAAAFSRGGHGRAADGVDAAVERGEGRRRGPGERIVRCRRRRARATAGGVMLPCCRRGELRRSRRRACGIFRAHSYRDLPHAPAFAPRRLGVLTISSTSMALLRPLHRQDRRARAICEMVRQFADEQIIPNAEHYDHEDSSPSRSSSR